MGTELAKTDEVLLKEYEAAVGSSKGFLGMPRLFFNRTAVDRNGEIIVDDEGKPLGMGSYNVSTLDGNWKEVRFTPTHVTYSYIRTEEQDDKSWKVLSSSILFTDWKADPISSDGTLRAGRASKKMIEDMDDEDAKKAKDFAPCYMHLFGLVTVEDDDGDDVSTPVELRIRGGNFFTMSQILKEIKDYAKYELTLNADVNNDNKDNIFGFITATASTTKVAVTKELVETAVGFGKYIENYNDMIRNQYKKALRGEDLEAEAEELVGEVIDGDFEEVTDDDADVTAEEVFEEEEEDKPKAKKKAAAKVKDKAKKKKAEVVEDDDDDLEDLIPF